MCQLLKSALHLCRPIHAASHGESSHHHHHHHQPARNRSHLIPRELRRIDRTHHNQARDDESSSDEGDEADTAPAGGELATDNPILRERGNPLNQRHGLPQKVSPQKESPLSEREGGGEGVFPNKDADPKPT